MTISKNSFDWDEFEKKAELENNFNEELNNLKQDFIKKVIELKEEFGIDDNLKDLGVEDKDEIGDIDEDKEIDSDFNDDALEEDSQISQESDSEENNPEEPSIIIIESYGEELKIERKKGHDIEELNKMKEIISSTIAEMEEISVKFEDNAHMNVNEIKKKKTNFIKELQNLIDIYYNRNLLSTIEFDAYSIYSFFKTLSTIFFEANLEIKNDHIYALKIDPQRIYLAEIILTNDKYKFYQGGKIGVDLVNLQKLLRCKRTDNSRVELSFGFNNVFIDLHSKKFGSRIERVLKTIYLEENISISLDALDFANYKYQFELTKEKLNYVIENFGIYGNDVVIICSQEKLVIKESSRLGENKIIWKDSAELNINPLEEAYDQGELDPNGVQQRISLNFLKILNKMNAIMDKGDKIVFYISDSLPLGAEIKFKNLGGTSTKFYVAPIVYDEDEY
ncbi:MAG: hypothetical protein ACTSU2_12360 [Promethearchaeota archaeon]